MNLCRLIPLFIVGSTAIGGSVAAFLHLDLFMGLTIGFFVGLSPLAMLLGLGYVLELWWPDRPVCRASKCRSSDYEFLEWRKSETKNGKPFSFIYRCRCGHRYMQREKRFIEILDDGTEEAFMVISKWGRWMHDDVEKKALST